MVETENHSHVYNLELSWTTYDACVTAELAGGFKNTVH